MPIAFRNKGKHNHTLRRLTLIAVVISTLVAMPVSPLPETVKAQRVCAPYEQCLFGGCWYNLLNNEGFDGNICPTNDWVYPPGYTVSSSSICNTDPTVTRYSNVLVLPYASGTYQDFSVPYDATKPLKLSLIFAIVGTPTYWDRLVVDIEENGRTIDRQSIRLDRGYFYCHREDFEYTNNNYAGRNLRLKVRSSIVTRGVEVHIDWIQMIGNR